MAAVQCIKSCRCGSGASVNVHINHQTEKCDLSDFDCGKIVGARRAGLSISVTADPLGSLEFTQNGAKNKKTSSEQQSVGGQKRFVNKRSQRRWPKPVR